MMILFPIGNPQKAVRIDLADVARVKPSAGKRLCRFTLPVVVALHDVGTTNQDLSVLRNLDFLIADFSANRTETHRIADHSA